MKRIEMRVLIPDNGGIVFFNPNTKPPTMFHCMSTDAPEVGQTLMAMIATMELETPPAKPGAKPAEIEITF